MNQRLIIGIITIILFLLSATQIVQAEEKIIFKNNYFQKTMDLINNRNCQDINNISKITWFPGLLITLLLAPFIILYLIIAIILDIGNP
jgi:hypothetical protein